jgi:hypothetical protein
MPDEQKGLDPDQDERVMTRVEQTTRSKVAVCDDFTHTGSRRSGRTEIELGQDLGSPTRAPPRTRLGTACAMLATRNPTCQITMSVCFGISVCSNIRASCTGRRSDSS